VGPLALGPGQAELAGEGDELALVVVLAAPGGVLAATHDAAEAVITPFMDHPDPAVRSSANEALTELRASD
jgi:hypothetical protein